MKKRVNQCWFNADPVSEHNLPGKHDAGGGGRDDGHLFYMPIEVRAYCER